MSNVEDVSEEQRGILASIFSYGTLTVQTAGEMENFIFTLCPNPAALADRIIEARQAYAQSVQEENEAH
jgi:guanylate kinase